MQPGFVILDHPADLGIEARGRTLAEAFEQAAIALMSIILDLTTVEPKELRRVQLKATDQEQLLVRWLEELLYLYDGENFVGSKFVI
jgi:SHS2 domain-containing protein